MKTLIIIFAVVIGVPYEKRAPYDPLFESFMDEYLGTLNEGIEFEQPKTYSKRFYWPFEDDKLSKENIYSFINNENDH